MAGRVKHNSAGIVSYRKPKLPVIEFDHQLALEMLESSIVQTRGLSREPAIGKCYVCGKKVTGARKLCGLCTAKREQRHKE